MVNKKDATKDAPSQKVPSPEKSVKERVQEFEGPPSGNGVQGKVPHARKRTGQDWRCCCMFIFCTGIVPLLGIVGLLGGACFSPKEVSPLLRQVESFIEQNIPKDVFDMLPCNIDQVQSVLFTQHSQRQLSAASCENDLAQLRTSMKSQSATLKKCESDHSSARSGQTSCEKDLSQLRTSMESQAATLKKCNKDLAEVHVPDCSAVERASQEDKKEIDSLRKQLQGLQDEMNIVKQRCAQDIQELKNELQRVQSAQDPEREALIRERDEERARRVALENSCSAGAAPNRQSDGGASSTDGAAWDSCIDQQTVFRGMGKHAVFEDITGLKPTARGCWQGNCKNTDKFECDSAAECATTCSQIRRCNFWSLGKQEGKKLCFLRVADGGRSQDPDFVSGARDCVPPQGKEVPPAQVALAVLESASLQACEGHNGAASCPSQRDAMRTWRYGIQRLREALGDSQTDATDVINQIANDVDAFLSMDQPPAEAFGIIVSNCRQVFEALRGFLSMQDSIDIHTDDTSLPRPARGLVCSGPCGEF